MVGSSRRWWGLLVLVVAVAAPAGADVLPPDTRLVEHEVRIDLGDHASSAPRRYRVTKGDTLGGIAQKELGRASRHPEITREWRPGPEVLDAFRDFVVAKKIETAENLATGFEVEAHRAYALRQIRAEVFTSRFGIEAAHQAQAEGDVQIQTALTLFPRAEELLAERQKLDRKPEIATSPSPSDTRRN